MTKKSYHSLCAWTFNAGKGGFTPYDTRQAWSGENLDTVGKIKLVKDKIQPRLDRARRRLDYRQLPL